VFGNPRFPFLLADLRQIVNFLFMPKRPSFEPDQMVHCAPHDLIPGLSVAERLRFADIAASAAWKEAAMWELKRIFAPPRLGYVCGAGFLVLASVDARACSGPVGEPCVEGFQQGKSVIFDFSQGLGSDWEFFNVRYKTAKGVKQVENRSGKFTVKNARSDQTYTISVQGCNSNFLSSSDCTSWVTESFTTIADFGPDTCQRGFVWREAGPQDHVCVTPERRDRAAADNAHADERRQPGGGAYGPNTCRQGYVWREAFPGDVVCVPPEIRELTRGENELAASRRRDSN
jgi:hypothetical protein